MKLLITGDLVINKPYNVSYLTDEIIDLFHQSDYNIVNLEAPVTDSTSKILKTGPNIKSDASSTQVALKTLQIKAVTLANNHLLDYYEKGVQDTLDFCKKQNIQTVGGGMNIKKAVQPLLIETKEGKIGIVNFAENEWANAQKDSAGANPMDVVENVRQIQNIKKQADFVFVIVHGGHEHYNLPSPQMQKQYRFYAENGADLVVGHHTHCMNGNEVHKGTPIYYSLGNFLFTKPSRFPDWYQGLVLGVSLDNGKLMTHLHPVRQDKETFKLSLMSGEAKNEVLKRVEKYNNIIENDQKLNHHWTDYVAQRQKAYLTHWSPLSFIKNKYLKALFNKLGFRMQTKQGLRLYLNLMRCEAHRDLSIESLKNRLKECK